MYEKSPYTHYDRRGRERAEQLAGYYLSVIGELPTSYGRNGRPIHCAYAVGVTRRPECLGVRDT